jgi:predicted RNase H-like nuclease (RuvC/YqgF family)
MFSRESFLRKYFQESYKKIKREVEKIFEEIEKKDKENKKWEKEYFKLTFESINKMIEMVDTSFEPETKLNSSEQEIDNLEKNLSTQNTTPQPLTEEECKICPIKEAKIAELKTSLDQANQD